MSEETKVEIAHAYRWVCPTCKAIHYEDSIPAEFSEEDKEDAAEVGIDAVTGEWETYPEQVICEDCGDEFETVH